MFGVPRFPSVQTQRGHPNSWIKKKNDDIGMDGVGKITKYIWKKNLEDINTSKNLDVLKIYHIVFSPASHKNVELMYYFSVGWFSTFPPLRSNFPWVLNFFFGGGVDGVCVSPPLFLPHHPEWCKGAGSACTLLLRLPAKLSALHLPLATPLNPNQDGF